MNSRMAVAKNITVIAVSVIISVFIALRIPNRSNAGNSSVDRFEVITQRGTIRAGYYVGAPFFIKDANTGKVSGIFADVTEEACSNLGLKVEWTEEVGFGQMIEGFNSNRFDIVGSGAWENSSRAKGADFTNPVLFDAVCAFVRSDDHRFDNDMNLINEPGVKISTIDGEMASLIAKTDFPKAAVVSMPQATDFTQMVLNVTNRKADVTFLGVAVANKFIAANPGSIRNITIDRPVRIFPTSIMVKQGEYRLTRMLNLALAELHNNGRIEAIIRKYEEHRGSHYRVSPSYSR